MTDPSHELTRELEAIQGDATRVLRKERSRRAQRPAIEGALLIGGAIAVAYLLYLAIAHGLSVSWPALQLPALIALFLGPPAIFYVVRIVAAGSRAISRDQALAAVDERHGTKDRLRTAVDFLGHENRTPFMQAAVLDAVPFARDARARGLPVQPAPKRMSGRAQAGVVAVAALLVAAILIPAPAVNPAVPEDEDQPEVAQLEGKADPDRNAPDDATVTPREKEEPAPGTTSPAPQRTAGKGRKDTQLSSEIKKTRGAMGSGQSADAASSTGTSEARGAPSSQAQASKAGKKPTKKKKVKPKKRKKPEEGTNDAKKPEDDSGATAGRGAASGSNKSPSASPWASKDQVTSEDEDDLEDDEEVDDEFDNSDARGGVQPHLRDRRPPVNRDLGIGFGNQKNPDANGRGGPSEMKKSRGVASLVLGVPIPDHVKGRPNPGKTKITQERVEPKVEDSAAVDATDRQPRSAPVGHFENPPLEPWMRDLIRKYFRTIRPAANRPDSNPPQDKKP